MRVLKSLGFVLQYCTIIPYYYTSILQLVGAPEGKGKGKEPERKEERKERTREIMLNREHIDYELWTLEQLIKDWTSEELHSLDPDRG